MQILENGIALYTYQFGKYLIMKIITRITEDIGNESPASLSII